MIERTESEGIVTLRLAHGKASAMDLELCDELARQVEACSDAAAVILTGSGSIFSAGVDLFRILNDGDKYTARFLPALERTIRALFTLERPVVAAVNGHAIAGGCVLAAGCDIRLLAQGGARIGVPELLVGVPFPAIVLEVMRFAVAPHRLQEVVYTGGTFGGEDALARGLVDEIVPADALMSRAMDLAKRLADIPREAFAQAKRQMRAPALAAADAFASRDADATARQWRSEETRERIARYMERTVGKKGV